MSSNVPQTSTGLVVRPYRDFLTPMLHRRFTSAALVTLPVCYVEAMLMGKWDLFWFWFPFGPTGLRALLLFISVLAVYILRVAQLHIGARTTVFPFATPFPYLLASSFTVAQTVMWYTFSAWFFGEVYIWSASAHANLSVVGSATYARARLNERSIYLRTLFLSLGVAQAIYHLYEDYDRLPFDTVKTIKTCSMNLPTRPPQFETAMKQMRQKYLSILMKVPIRTITMVVMSTIIYAVFLQHLAWTWTFAFTKNLYSLPKASSPSAIPASPVTLILHALFSATMLTFLWEFSNLAFGAFVGQEPLKKGGFLSEGARPLANSTLISGLKSKKEVIKSFAYWELLLIAKRPEGWSGSTENRRKTIFTDLKVGNRSSTWSEIVSISLGELHAVAKRIQDHNQPNQSKTQQPDQNPKASLQSLPKISDPLSQGNIFNAPPPPPTRYAAIENNIGTFAKSHGQSPGAVDPVSPRARKLLTYTEKLLPEKTPLQVSVKNQLQSYVKAFLRTPLGYPFRQTFARRATAVVLGTPYSQLSPLVDVVNALATLTGKSLIEDRFGQVSSDVPNIIRVYTKTCDAVEQFVQQQLPVHWTDVEFDENSEGRGRKVEEVEIFVAHLREGLKLLVNQFGEYADTLGLTRAELRHAKEVVQRGSKKQAESS